MYISLGSLRAAYFESLLNELAPSPCSGPPAKPPVDPAAHGASRFCKWGVGPMSVGIQCIRRDQMSSHVITLGLKYLPES